VESGANGKYYVLLPTFTQFCVHTAPDLWGSFWLT
jgi:hypothetical protein